MEFWSSRSSQVIDMPIWARIPASAGRYTPIGAELVIGGGMTGDARPRWELNCMALSAPALLASCIALSRKTTSAGLNRRAV
jgi:hypothetical protein